MARNVRRTTGRPCEVELCGRERLDFRRVCHSHLDEFNSWWNKHPFQQDFNQWLKRKNTVYHQIPIWWEWAERV